MDRRELLRRSPLALVMVTALVLGSSTTTMIGADWPSFRGPAHDGKSAETIVWPKAGPNQLWKINVGIGHSALSVVGDRAYTMGNANETDTVFSLDIASGKVHYDPKAGAECIAGARALAPSCPSSTGPAACSRALYTQSTTGTPPCDGGCAPSDAGHSICLQYSSTAGDGATTSGSLTLSFDCMK